MFQPIPIAIDVTGGNPSNINDWLRDDSLHVIEIIRFELGNIPLNSYYRLLNE
jgi:hypothetical protein